MTARKKAMSIRMNPGDIRDVKRLATRLQVNESDVIRYAVKSTLLRLAPLCEESLRGRGLLPVLMETSGDLFRHFELDPSRLDSIVNGEVKDVRERVDREDLRLIAMHGMQRSYATVEPLVATEARATEPSPNVGAPPAVTSSERALRQYLYKKYVLRPVGSPPAAGGMDEQ